MKKLTAFFTIAILVCIATLVVFASNQNRDVSHCFLIREGPNDDFPGKYSEEDNTGTDSQGPLWSTASSWFSYYRNNDGKLRAAASGYGYVSCSPSNGNYETKYSLYAKVPSVLQDPHERNPQTVKQFGSFSDSAYVSGDGNGNIHRGGASGSASASGKNPANGDQHNTSAASPTPSTARDLEIID